MRSILYDGPREIAGTIPAQYRHNTGTMPDASYRKTVKKEQKITVFHIFFEAAGKWQHAASKQFESSDSCRPQSHFPAASETDCQKNRPRPVFSECTYAFRWELREKTIRRSGAEKSSSIGTEIFTYSKSIFVYLPWYVLSGLCWCDKIKNVPGCRFFILGTVVQRPYVGAIKLKTFRVAVFLILGTVVQKFYVRRARKR